jgi:hypothetical protein
MGTSDLVSPTPFHKPYGFYGGPMVEILDEEMMV